MDGAQVSQTDHDAPNALVPDEQVRPTDHEQWKLVVPHLRDQPDDVRHIRRLHQDISGTADAKRCVVLERGIEGDPSSDARHCGPQPARYARLWSSLAMRLSP